MRRRTHALLWSVSSLLICASVRAHDPPEIGAMSWAKGGSVLVLRTNRGLIFGEPGNADWRLMCGAAWGTPFGEQPDLAHLPDGQLLAATTVGLQTSRDEGCTWQGVEPFASVKASALAQHPADPKILYLGIFGAERSGLYESRDAGATWTKRLLIGPADHIAQVKLAPSDPKRLYVNGLTHDERTDKFSFQITRSTDAGASWKRFYVPLIGNEQESTLLAISPLDPETLLVRAVGAEHGLDPDRMLISRDGGATWKTLLQAPSLLDAGFSVDGKTVFIAGNEGFFRSNAELSEVTQVGEAQFVSHVDAHDGSLYLCGSHSGFDPLTAGVGISRDDGQSFSRVMAFTEVKRTVTCPADSKTAQQCKNLWIDWQVEVLVGVGGAPLDSIPDWRSFDSAEPEPTTGRPTLSTATAPEKTSPQAEGGCTLARGDHTPSRVWFLLPLALLFRRRRTATNVNRSSGITDRPRGL